MRWYCLPLLLFVCSPSFSKQELPPDSTHVKQLIQLSIRDQWVDLYRSLDYADQALKLAQEINYRRGIAIAHNLKGFCFWAFGDNELAIQSAHNALLTIGEDHDPMIEAESYYVMARGYLDLLENAKAREAILKAQALATQVHDSTQLCAIYNLRGVIMFSSGKVDSALYLYNKAYEIGQGKSVDPIHLPRIISNIGECFQAKHPDLALHEFKEALALAKKTGNKVAEASITSIIGHAYLNANDLKTAEINLQSALDLASRLGLRRVVRHAYAGLVDIKLRQRNGNEAVVYLRRYYSVRDSLLNTSKIRQIVELEAKYSLALSAKNIELLENQNRIDTIWRYLLIGVVILLIIALVFILRWQRYRYRKNREMLNLKIDYLTKQHQEALDKYRSYKRPKAKKKLYQPISGCSSKQSTSWRRTSPTRR
jgi:tetratricopeptide (TPR) repeat protein